MKGFASLDGDGDKPREGADTGVLGMYFEGSRRTTTV